MKKIIVKIVLLTIVIVSLCCNICHADLIDVPRTENADYFSQGSATTGSETSNTSTEEFNVLPTVIIGVAIVIIVGVSVVVLTRSKNAELQFANKQ